LAEASGNAPEPFDPALRIGLAQAEEIRARIAGSDGYVALLPGAVGDPRRFYLPFLLDTTELYIADPADEREVRGLVAAAPRLGEERIGGATVRRFLYLERRAAAVDLTRTAAPPR
jgi:hypothetical protein